MAVDISDLSAGCIVWATVRDARGYRKRRPVIILTPTAEIEVDVPLSLIAVTTTYPEPAPIDCVELPWNPDPRRVSTGLGRRSAAVLGWLDAAYADEVDQIIGTVPPRVLAEIYRRLRHSAE